MKYLFLLALVILGGGQVLAMTVEEAYQSIPHRRTVFDVKAAKMDPADAAYLVELFNWMDEAIVAKQSVLRGADIEDAYKPVWDALKKLQPPSKMKAVQESYILAAKDEYAYLREWKKTKSFNLNAPRINQASGRLFQGYNEMMRVYASEDSHNKDAFFDYPCALDFK